MKVKSDDHGPQEYKAKNVVAAPRNYQLPNIPACASNLGSDIQQLCVGTYTNPSAIRDGAILVVGAFLMCVLSNISMSISGIDISFFTFRLSYAKYSSKISCRAFHKTRL